METFEGIAGLKRTCYCGEVRSAHIGQAVTLFGWVHRARDHGGVIFVDLRDREGIVQVKFDPSHNSQLHDKANALRNEWVIAVRGAVTKRPEGMENPNLSTGEIEVVADELRILSEAKSPPFQIEDETDAGEPSRLTYRYIDLRRKTMFERFRTRHRICAAVRRYFDSLGFVDVETPFLTKSTPEGARDYLVPSRRNPGKFFALPQSPQLFKQILMISGFDRYYQIVRCMRDEDLREDRQPEFTQIDVEMSFITREDIISTMEGMMGEVFKAAGIEPLPKPYPRISYDDAIARYGVDNPDVRFGLEHKVVTELFTDSKFGVFKSIAASGGLVKAINVKGGGNLSRKEIDDLTAQVGELGLKGMAYIKVNPDGWQSPIVKFFGDLEKEGLQKTLDPQPGDLVLFGADNDPRVVNRALGWLRKKLAEKLGLIKPSNYKLVWVLDFPMFEYSDEERRWAAMHHPFTSPRIEDLDLLEKDPGKVKAVAYDLVLNGNEIGGGSIRIHRTDLQQRVFRALKIGEEEAQEKFGFLLEALSHGAPPHGGIAFGLDRMVMILTGATSLREVIAFPKTQKPQCLMTGAPSRVDPAQLVELHLRLAGVTEEDLK